MAQAVTPRRAAAAVALVALVGGALTLNHNLVGVFYDDGLYAALAWATAHGLGYVFPNLPGTPAAVHYPPLYPWVLAPLFGFLSVPTAAFAGKVLNVICSAATCALITWHAARMELVGPGTPPWLLGAIVAVSALAIPCLTVLTALLSEPLFGLLLVTTVMLGDRPPVRFSPELGAALAGTAAALVLLDRSVGLAVGAALLVRVFITARAQGRAAIVRRVGLAAAPLAAAGLGWGAWVILHRSELDPLLIPDYGSYFQILGGAGLAGLGAAARDLARPLGALTLGWVPNSIVYYVCGIPALAVGLYGLVCLARRSLIGLTLAAYLVILACWPVPPDRFLWAVLPWLALAWAAGAADLLRRKQLLRVPVIALAAVLALGYARYEVRGFRGRWWALPADRVSAEFSPVLPALDSLPRDAIIATDHDPLVWLYTRRSAVPLYLYALQRGTVLEPPPPVHRAYLERHGVTHILVVAGDVPGAQELERLRQAYPGLIRLVRQWPDHGAVFEVNRDR